jgi:hypothetical protein
MTDIKQNIKLISDDSTLLASANNSYKRLNGKVYRTIYDIVRRHNDYLSLQDPSCDAIYTNLFNEKFGHNIEYRVIGIIIINKELLFVMIPIDLEDIVKDKILTKTDVEIKYQMSRLLLTFVRHDSNNLSQTYLFHELVKSLYPHLISNEEKIKENMERKKAYLFTEKKQLSVFLDRLALTTIKTGYDCEKQKMESSEQQKLFESVSEEHPVYVYTRNGGDSYTLVSEVSDDTNVISKENL